VTAGIDMVYHCQMFLFQIFSVDVLLLWVPPALNYGCYYSFCYVVHIQLVQF